MTLEHYHHRPPYTGEDLIFFAKEHLNGFNQSYAKILELLWQVGCNKYLKHIVVYISFYHLRPIFTKKKEYYTSVDYTSEPIGMINLNNLGCIKILRFYPPISLPALAEMLSCNQWPGDLQEETNQSL